MKTITTSKNSYHTLAAENVAHSLVATDYKDPPTIMNIAEEEHLNSKDELKSVDCRNGQEDVVKGYIQTGSYKSRNCNSVSRANNVVRRLTPLECERLQGFPDGWTDIGEWIDSKGKKHKEADSPRYKALGNSIALPFWQYLARRICAQYERDITMASLFDGIGGFPYVFRKCGATPVWASEIEEFPIAVTKKRFGED